MIPGVLNVKILKVGARKGNDIQAHNNFKSHHQARDTDSTLQPKSFLQHIPGPLPHFCVSSFPLFDAALTKPA